MVKMRVKYLLQLFWYFIVTEIVSGIELAIWLRFRESFLNLMNLENDVFGVRFTLVAIPAILAVAEYQSKKRKISKALYNLLSG